MKQTAEPQQRLTSRRKSKFPAGNRSHLSSLIRVRAYWPMIAILLAAIIWTACALRAQTATAQSTLKLDTGEEIYKAGCVSCHGPDGRGQPTAIAGFQRPDTFPDFTDCSTTTPEPDVQWRAQITNGGPARGFSQIMPSFKDMLTQDQIGKVLEYLRTLCTDKSWPRGDLNLPRPMLTEKAFPEDEVVIQGGFNVQKSPGGGTTAFYEKRIGPKGMIEIAVPYLVTHDTVGTHSAFGDVSLGYKRALYANFEHGSIFSAGGDISFPTGSTAKGTGGDSTSTELFVAFGQVLPRQSFLHAQTGFELPVHPGRMPRAYFLRGAVGKTFANEAGLGRRWSPMSEFILDRDLVTGAKTNFDVIPQIQIPLSRRMHILASVGLQVPVNNTATRPRQLVFYLLWDYVDGGLKDGWK